MRGDTSVRAVGSRRELNDISTGILTVVVLGVGLVAAVANSWAHDDERDSAFSTRWFCHGTLERTSNTYCRSCPKPGAGRDDGLTQPRLISLGAGEGAPRAPIGRLARLTVPVMSMLSTRRSPCSRQVPAVTFSHRASSSASRGTTDGTHNASSATPAGTPRWAKVPQLPKSSAHASAKGGRPKWGGVQACRQLRVEPQRGPTVISASQVWRAAVEALEGQHHPVGQLEPPQEPGNRRRGGRAALMAASRR